MKKIRVGIIGLGRILPRHLQDSIEQIDLFELTAVCDKNKDLAKKIGEEENVPYYTDYKKLISQAPVDIVSVLTPNYLHPVIGIYAANHGLHCIMEKPIAQNYKDALSLVNAFKKNKKYLFPVLQVRYNPAIQIVKKHVEEGYLGKIHTAVLSIHWTRPQEYFDESEWKGKKTLDGGTLLTQAIHYIDATQYILGKVKNVFGKIATVGHKIEVEDIANSIIDLKNGTRVSLDFTVCTYPQNLECALTILGEKGTIKIGGLAMNTVDFWEVKNTPKPHIPEGLLPNIYAGGMYVGSCPNHRFIYENVANVLLKKERNFIPAVEALESLRIIDAIVSSSKKKKEIAL